MDTKVRNGIKIGASIAVASGIIRASRAFMPMYPSVIDYLTIGTAGVIFGMASRELVADQIDKCIDMAEDLINGNGRMIVM